MSAYSRLRQLRITLPHLLRTPSISKCSKIVIASTITTCCVALPNTRNQKTLLDDQRRDFRGSVEQNVKAEQKQSPKRSNTIFPPPPPEIFDIRRHWDAATDAADFWDRVFLSNNDQDSMNNNNNNVNSKRRSENNNQSDIGSKQRNHNNKSASTATPDEDFQSIAQGFLKSLMVTGGLAAPPGAESIQELVSHARANADHGDIEDDDQSLEKILDVLMTYKDKIKVMLEKYLGNMELEQLTPTSLFYYLEYEDERKNPSWKKRQHRFHRGVDVDTIRELNDALYLSELSYADTKDEIIKGLRECTASPYELVYLDLSSAPGKPSHFIALKCDQQSPAWSMLPLEITIVVRGTKTFTDVMTDILCEVEDYRGGKAHSGILTSGKYLKEKHLALIEDLRRKSGKSRVKLNLIGHSLGAGAASIAGIEFNDLDTIDCKVVGFGCPALLSQELSEKTASFITTVINDSDCIPRMSLATISNLLLDMIEFDWVPAAKRDVHHALREINKTKFPITFPDEIIDKFIETIDPLLESSVPGPLSADKKQKNDEKRKNHRLQPVLFPPGSCIHLYLDGHGISASVAPCTFFGEIDVTRRMIDDHLFFTGYEQIFLEVVRQHLKDHHFRFDSDKKR